MSDFLGPADAPNSVSARPADGRTFGPQDSWFKDCTSPTAEDGTDLQASWFNGLLGALRSVWRVNGKLADNTTNIVAETGTDDGGLAKALQHLIQRAQQSYAVGTGSANAIVASFTPAPPELKAGMHFRIKVAVSNTGATTAAINGFDPIAVKRPNGSGLSAGDIVAGGIAILVFDGTYFQLAASHTDATGEEGASVGFRVPYTIATGPSVAIEGTYDPETPTPEAGHLFSIKLIANISGPTTFAPDGHGPYPIKTPNGSALTAGYALINDLILMEFDGTNFVIISKTSAVPTASYPIFPAVGSYYWRLDNFTYYPTGNTVSLPGLPGAWYVINCIDKAFMNGNNGTDNTPTYANPTYFSFFQRIA